MAEEYIGLLRGLDHTMNKFNDTLCQQSISQFVGSYDGHSGSCRDWISSLEKFSTIHRFEDGKKIDAALLTAKSAVEDFIRRWKMARPEHEQKWSDLSAELLAHFGLVVDANHALDLLRRIKQIPQENVSMYAERVHKLSREAYTTDEMNQRPSYDMAQRQLVNYFTDGLMDRAIKLKIMRQGPATLDDALRIARAETNLMRRFELRHGRPSRSHNEDNRPIEPMEVDHVRSRMCNLCGRRGHVARFCSRRQNQIGNGDRPRHVHVVQPRQRGVCYLCGSPDHYKPNCPRRNQGRKPDSRQNQNGLGLTNRRQPGNLTGVKKF